MSRSIRMLLLQKSLSDHIRSSTSRALDVLSKGSRESHMTVQNMFLSEQLIRHADCHCTLQMIQHERYEALSVFFLCTPAVHTGADVHLFKGTKTGGSYL
ncbi:hypothetical protein WMY93_006041 [Mugilogobius chulae]|uniref:Uncharacterized protein n=1 Tax=Mugilogobius chulae TaxID=88201 RepID=A0AAW0PL82_9GOBI